MKTFKEFLEESKISELLRKYNKFMPVPIKFGTREETLPLPKDAKEDAKPETKTVDNIINNSSPAWTKTPSELSDEDYKNFYRELYPMQFEEPLFNIHLNVDYPFNLTGILYFPKIKNDLNIQKDKIQLYQNKYRPILPTVVEKLTESLNRSPDESLCQAALRFVYSRSFMTSAMPGMFQEHEVDDNYAALQSYLKLSQNDHGLLEAARQLASAQGPGWLPSHYRWLDQHWRV